MEDDLYSDPKLPSVLVKAFTDKSWDYMLGLRNGTIIRFKGAELQHNRKWVTLLGHEGKEYTGGDEGSIEMSGTDHHFPRGLDVRISDIAWVADAPDGS